MAPKIAVSPSAYRHCFGCGPENPIGLHLAFERVDGGARAEFRPRPEHQGWDGVVHGGILMTLLDEVLAYACGFVVGPAVTAELRARLRRPAPLDERYVLVGRVDAARLRFVRARATIVDSAGRLIAEADGKFMVIGEEVTEE